MERRPPDDVVNQETKVARPIFYESALDEAYIAHVDHSSMNKDYGRQVGGGRWELGDNHVAEEDGAGGVLLAPI